MKNKILLISILLLFIILPSCKKDNGPGIFNRNSINNATGTSANALLSDDKYKSLQFEIQYMEGFKPTEGAVNNVIGFLENYIKKPNGIHVKYTQIPAEGQSSYSVNDIDKIENSKRTVFNDGDKIGVYMLFVDGPYSGNNGGTVLGVAYANTSMAIFEKDIKNASGGITQPSTEKLETAVMNHEFGHILGLVNTGSPMQNNHQDDEHGHHCNVESCLMYYAVETGNFVNNLMNSPVPDLDAQCKADLTANGGK